MFALGWGLATVLGAVAGMMIAPVVFLDPNMMQTILLYAFAAAVLGGLDSPVGAVVGGLLLGVDDHVARPLRRLRRVDAEAAGGAPAHPRACCSCGRAVSSERWRCGGYEDASSGSS